MASIHPPPTHPQPLTASKVSPKTVENAVNALLKWRNSKSETQKPQLLEQDDFVYLILTLKKIPPKGRINAFKITLPHSLLNPTLSELCLIIDDRPKSGLSKDDVKKKIQSENIPVSKVIKLSKLKSDYRPFEAKRKLCGSYDMFFADRRIVHLLPKMLGKHFFKRKKIPVPVDLKHKNWKEQIEKACSSALLYLRSGTCSVVKVGKLSMEAQEIVGNVMTAINGIVELVPKKWGNVRSFHLKLMESLALPLYQAVPDMKLKIEGVKNEEEEKVAGNVEEEGVKEEQKNNKNLKKKKGKIHEVRYMDHSAAEILDEDEFDSVDGDGSEGGGITGDEGLKGTELVGKKRKKGNKKIEVFLGKLDGEKHAKKTAKLKNDDGTEKKKKKLSTDDNGSKPKKGKLLKKGEEEAGAKEIKEKKKSALKKLKGGEMKVKAKKSKEAAD